VPELILPSDCVYAQTRNMFGIELRNEPGKVEGTLGLGETKALIPNMMEL